MDKDIKNNFSQLPLIRNAKQRMMDAKSQPHIKQLCSMIWQTDELHLLFADTGIGKSILAVALSNALSKGIKFMFLENENEALPVLYYDFELSDKQFEKRYTGIKEYDFSENFFIDNIDFAALTKVNPEAKFNDLLFDKIKYDITQFQPKVLVIDNLTFLNTQSMQETEIALGVMRQLNELKKEYGLSILVLAHTPKRSLFSPITLNDLAGSKHLSNFADSVSALGKSPQDDSIRYWKQVKASRSGEMLYGTNNVIACKIIKPDDFLTFEFIDFCSEYDHLKTETEKKETPSQVYDVADMVKQKIPYDEIANRLGISKGTITKWKNKYTDLFVSVSSVSESTLFGNEETGNDTV